MEQRVRAQVLRWADELIDLSRRNTSLNLRPVDPAAARPRRTSLQLVRPAPARILELLQSSRRLEFHLPEPAPPTSTDATDETAGETGEVAARQPRGAAAGGRDELLITDRLTSTDVEATLRALARQAEADRTDKGLRTLYCCFGLLEWREADHDGETLRSPLVFVPVWLERPSVRQPHRLLRVDGDVVLNPSLRVRLERDFDVTLPEIDDVDAFDGAALDTVMEQVRAAAAGQRWRVHDEVHLKRATFHKEAMFRDLRDNVDRIAAHPLVRALAADGAGTPDTGEIDVDEQRMDELAPPERSHLILNADATQRRAIHAAVEGRSFVMDGPPGSGKSQTIANMLAELVVAGRSVLFVSEKAAALEVVADRLRGRGLEHLLFELYSERTTRKEVAAALGHALEEAPVAHPRLAPADLERARQLRARLSGYATAVNTVRAPLGRSVHWVLGRLAQLAGVPAAPLPSGIDESLGAAELGALSDRFAQLAAVWAPAEHPDEFLWRGLTPASAEPGARERLRQLLNDLLRRLGELEEQGAALALDAGLPAPERRGDAERLVATCTHCREQPRSEASWWTSAALPDVERRVLELRRLTGDRAAAVQALESAVGADRWAELPPDGAARLRDTLDQLRRLRPSPAADQLDRERIQRLLEHCADTTALAGELRRDGADLAAALGAGPRSRTAAEVLALARVGELADAPVRPEPRWAAPRVAARVQQALDDLTPPLEEYRQRRADLVDVFDDRVYDLDLRGLTIRFEQVHRGWRKLAAAYWTDKRTVAGVSRTGRAPAAVRARLRDALAVVDLGERLDRQETTCRDLLGRFYQPRDTDTAAAAQALRSVRLAAELLGGDYDPDAVAAQLAGGDPRDPRIAGRSRRLRTRIERWADAPGGLLGPGGTDLTPEQLESWAEATAALLRTCLDLLGEVEGRLGRAAAVEHAGSILDQRATVHDTERTLAADAAADQALLGSWYAGADTPWDATLAAVRWTLELQRRYGGPLPPLGVQRLHDQPAPDPSTVADRLDAVTARATELGGWFEPARAEELVDALGGHLSDAAELVRGLLERIGQIDVWHAHVEQVAALRDRGWSATLDGCVADGVPSRQLPDVLERALLAAWLEAVLRKDPALRNVGREQLDTAVEQFRTIDRQLVRDAAERVVDAYLRRRPRTTVGPAGRIRYQAQLRRRHKPVRQQLTEAAEVVTDLKPCFMMSPLTVSQFLPPDFTFDVVIFDEASQISPADAVNCVYRGGQLVVAGDDRQLPPTSFFQLGGAEDEGDVYEEGQFDEFDSVLELCKGGGLPSLPLRWHYRSHHESLIAFSNYRFYEGKLVTFPSAADEREDLGVKLYLSEGHYRRGGPRDNPEEARLVAERVAHHAGQPNPPSIGVVAFSQAQADTIQDTIDRLRQDRPDLEHVLGSGERLGGFFVKNLENVQGDERDLMVFSVGYGPDEAGKLTLNFGPLNKDRGWRRLNVAITRARKRVEVVTSFTAGQLDTRGSTNRGVLELQRYLGYAERGREALALDDGQPGGGELESPLEESVHAVLRGWGYDVVPQVGTAGYRIDLGVRHPAEPGRFVLGVECDGAAYHSSAVARDRDRLRQEVLENLGWRLHRIWGPAWYRDRAGQERQLREVVEQALADGRAPARPPGERTPREQPPSQRPTVAAVLDQPPSWAVPYRVHVPVIDPPLGNPADQAEQPRLRRVVGAIAHMEAPIRTGLLARRVAQAWDCRVTERVRNAVDRAVRAHVRQGRFQLDGDVVRVPGTATDVQIRVPDPADDRSRRDIIEIPPHELRNAVRLLLAEARAAGEEELMTRVRRLFGFERTGSVIRAALEQALHTLLDEGTVTRGPDGFLRTTDHH